jgi:hypothetical protein
MGSSFDEQFNGLVQILIQLRNGVSAAPSIGLVFTQQIMDMPEGSIETISIINKNREVYRASEFSRPEVTPGYAPGQ